MTEQKLAAYHDGELGPFARWRFERRLRRSPELRGELSALRLMRDLLREHDALGPNPEVWDEIARRLPAADVGNARRPARVGLSLPWTWLPRPAGAVAVAALAGIALAIGLLRGDTTVQGAVRWMDSGGRSVLVLDDPTGATIIWLLDPAADAATRGGAGEVV